MCCGCCLSSPPASPPAPSAPPPLPPPLPPSSPPLDASVGLAVRRTVGPGESMTLRASVTGSAWDLIDRVLFAWNYTSLLDNRQQLGLDDYLVGAFALLPADALPAGRYLFEVSPAVPLLP